MKLKQIAVGFLLLIGIALPAAGSARQDAKVILFVQTARYAEMQAVPNKPNTYRLTLKEVSPYVTYFSERPYRVSGTVDTRKFVRQWKSGRNSFSKDAPNAAIVGVRDSLIDRKYVNYSVELSSIHYNPNKQTIRYTVRMLPGAHAKLPTTLKLNHVGIFIDGFCPGCER